MPAVSTMPLLRLQVKSFERVFSSVLVSVHMERDRLEQSFILKETPREFHIVYLRESEVKNFSREN
jgi:hypothetical protein